MFSLWLEDEKNPSGSRAMLKKKCLNFIDSVRDVTVFLIFCLVIHLVNALKK